ncbi:isoprenylcysteine carboxylmethyltransferase family protein [Deinococcus sp. JMULE3]|uniref:methyltransferase family protein n=1 Tax=Deinococcus sp. JMULE3 TaxID=2518341 RepID=UPI001576E9DF|nr:isoprenylcysteine carboxylmethyltransferase family protein [Deinococcus sp. JMULE3]NTY02430.1 isoprenylcysteine carboxylmethyltransferase family protein [Deinococcus sp. JMULE3]
MTWGTLNLLAFVACFGAFTWAMQGGLFRTTDQAPPGLTLIRVLGALSMAAQFLTLLLARQANDLRAGAGFVLYVGALALFAWAARTIWQRRLTLAFADDEPAHLETRGPYRWIRHPFYTAYVLGWLAGVLATGHLALLTTVLIMGTLYVRAARQEELKFARSALSGAYTSYRQRTGMFIPNLWSRTGDTP